MIFDLFTRCVLISLLAFWGGGAALPLIEHIAVTETGWVSAQDFATAVAFGYRLPRCIGEIFGGKGSAAPK